MSSQAWTERNSPGGKDLTAEGWEEMARLMEQATACTKRCAEALRKEGRHSVNFREAKKEWSRIVAQQLNVIGAAMSFPN